MYVSTRRFARAGNVKSPDVIPSDVTCRKKPFAVRLIEWRAEPG